MSHHKLFLVKILKSAMVAAAFIVTALAVFGTGSKVLALAEPDPKTTVTPVPSVTSKPTVTPSPAPRLVRRDGEYYFMSGDKYLTGWQDIEGERFYFYRSSSSKTGKAHNKGAMATGWQMIDGEKYYFYRSSSTDSGNLHTKGAMATGWQNIDGDKYFFYRYNKNTPGNSHKKGVLATGWQSIDGARYYFFKSAKTSSGKPHKKGAMATGMQKISGEKYYFYQKTNEEHKRGQMVKGPLKYNNEVYFFDRKTGMMKKDCYVKDKGTLYALKPNGEQFAICLDAGHIGIYNQSSTVKAYIESVFTWKFHLLLRDELKAKGFRVVLTRKSMYEPMDVDTRGTKGIGCDLFISIHSDAANDRSADFPTAYCAVNGSCDDIGMLLAQTIQRTIGTRQAARLEHRYYPGTNDTDYWGTVRNSVAVGCPGILLEHSFHTNYHTATWLLSDSNLAKLAAAEADTLEDFYLTDLMVKSGKKKPKATPTPTPGAAVTPTPAPAEAPDSPTEGFSWPFWLFD